MPEELAYISQPFVSEFYDYVELHRTRKDVAFHVGVAKEYGGPVLELASGTGRILLPIAREGVDIVGLELAKPMLDICRKKLEAEPEEVKWRVTLHQGDMRQFDLGRRFSLIMIPFNSLLQMTTTEDQLSVLKSVRNHLAADGHLVIDVFHPHVPYLVDESWFVKASEDAPVTLPDGRVMSRVMRNAAVDLPNQIISAEGIYTVTYPDGRVQTLVHKFEIRYIFRWEMEHLLVRSGFQLEKVYGGFDCQPFGSTEPGSMITISKLA